MGADPGAGEYVAVVGSGNLQTFNYWGNQQWTTKNGYAGSSDVGISGAWILFVKDGTLYKNYLNTIKALYGSIGSGVTGDLDYYYFTTTAGSVYRAVNTWN